MSGGSSTAVPDALGVVEGDYWVGEWLVQPSLNLISHGNTRVRLEPKVMQLLVCLAKHADTVVSKEEIMHTVWGDAFVTDQVLTHSIWELRQAFGERAKESQFIQTIAKGGYRLTSPVKPVAAAGGTSPEQTRPAEMRVPPTWIQRFGSRQVLLVVVALVVVALAGITYRTSRRTKETTRPGGKIMLAILPFENLSGDPSQEYFTDGITAEMVAQLGRLQPDRLGVVSRFSAMTYKYSKKHVDEIGKELNVDYVLEGSVRRNGNRVRVAAQLIGVKSAAQVWGDTYERDWGDVLLVQTEIARATAEALSLQLPLQRQSIERRYPQNVAAYDAYLRGRALVEQIDNPDKLAAARVQFERALQLDGNYPLALAGLSMVEAQYCRYIQLNETCLQREEQFAKRALALDPQLPEGHDALGHYYGNQYDYTRAAEEYRLAISLAPDDPFLLSGLAWALTYQQPPAAKEAEESARRAIRLAPTVFGSYYQLGRALMLQGRYEEAFAAYQHALELSPKYASPHVGLAEVYLAQGEYEKALQELQDAGRIRNAAHVIFIVSQVYAAKGDKTRALAELEKALANGYRDFPAIDANPYLAQVRSDPRFREVVQRYRKNQH
jgi:TolB-like protein/DNA-binding winged helix-turn-helix (wHTH) protein/cytochrome c-type biogenesis protein CcmH/NrfG